MKSRIILLFLIFICSITSVFAVTRNSYTKYGKHLMPNEFDPYFINHLENCEPHYYMDWTGTYKYVIDGRVNNSNLCKYRTQYNPWLKKNKNEWADYKICYFNEARLKEITNALKEHSGQISSYNLGPYKTTGTKVEYLLYSYEYYGACRLVKNKKASK